MDLSYTAGVEEQLDQVAEGNQKWVSLLSAFYGNFKKELDDADKGMQRPAAKETDEKCPVCGKMMLQKEAASASTSSAATRNARAKSI